MSWFLIALVAPALWSLTNHVDKFLLGKYFKEGGEGALLIFSSVFAVVTVPVIGVFAPSVFAIAPMHAVIMVLVGVVYIIALIPYMYAMQEDEASIVAPLFQLFAVFSYVFGLFFLHEQLTAVQFLAGVLIITGAVLLSVDFTDTPKFKWRVFWLMCLSSLLLSINAGVFKLVAIEYDFWTTLFWDYVGLIVIGLLLLTCVRTYRTQFFVVIKSNSASALGMNGMNELINVAAEMCFKYATTLAPLALVVLVNGVQPAFVFVYGILFTRFFPSFAQERMQRKYLVQKIIAIVLVCIGTYWIQR